MGQNDKALEDFNKAIDINPNYQRAYDNRGYLYLDLGEYESAINDFQKAIQLDEKHLDAHIGLSIVFFRQKRIEQAKMYYQKAIGIEPLSKEGADALEREKGYFYTTSQKQTINEILKLF
jgi:Tfp pilus assembly protein PilF